MIRGVVFDLDDTLYDERDYVRSGFAAVAHHAAGSEADARALSAWLSTAFEAGIRGDTFDRFRTAFPDVAIRWSTAQLVELYRTHRPTIAPAPYVLRTLDRMRDLDVRLGVLTDGPAASQEAKIDALGLRDRFRPILVTGPLGPDFAKPGTAGFDAIRTEWGLPAAELAYVGDNPEKDFVGPRILGWRSVRLRHARQLRHRSEPTDARHRPDIIIGSLADLMRVLDLGGP